MPVIIPPSGDPDHAVAFVFLAVAAVTVLFICYCALKLI